MRGLLLGCLCICIQACTATVHVDSVVVAEQRDNRLILRIDTTEELSQLEDGLHAYKIMLRYGVQPMAVTNTIPVTGEAERLPFLATREAVGDISKIENGKSHVSVWSVPLKGESGISGRTYSYDIAEKEGTLEMQLYGATMAWGHAKSPPFGVRIEPRK